MTEDGMINSARPFVRKRLVESFIDQIDETSKGLKTDLQIGELIGFVYSVREYPIKWNDVNLYKSLMDLMNNLLYRMLAKADRYNPRVATHILYLKEITYNNELYNRIEGGSEEEFKNSWNDFYKPLVEYSIIKATESIYIIVNNSRNKDDAQRYLAETTNNLMSLMGRIIHWHYADREEIIKCLKFFGKYVLYVSIFIFRKFYYFDQIPPRWVYDYSLNIAENSIAHGRLKGIDTDDFLEEVIYDYDFQYETPIYKYEQPDFITTATGVGTVYDFSLFWIAFSIFRLSRNLSPLPKNRERVNEEVINNLLNHISWLRENSLRIIKMSEIFRLRESELNRQLNNYKAHLEAVLDL